MLPTQSFTYSIQVLKTLQVIMTTEYVVLGKRLNIYSFIYQLVYHLTAGLPAGHVHLYL